MNMKLLAIAIFLLLPVTAQAAPADHSYYAVPLRIGGTDATPTTLLDVVGGIKLGNGSETCSAVAGSMRWDGTNFQGCDGTSWNSFTLDNTVPATNIATGNTSLSVVDTGSDGAIIFATEGTTWATITNAGKIGVGTASPTTALEINGSIKIGNGGETCDSTKAGIMLYDTTTARVVFCNGTEWGGL
jgi:hypothetical protein